jgi:hypothetical protein
MPASTAALKTAVATALIALTVSVAPASAAIVVPSDLPLSATPCKLDASPSYPSCGTDPR